jgi:hypothetical protein
LGDVDLAGGTVTVRKNRVELLETRDAFDADPKTDAGKRTVTVTPHVLRPHVGLGGLSRQPGNSAVALIGNGRVP